MFDIVRNNKRIVQLFLALITLPFAFWGVDSYVRTSGAGQDLAAVGEGKITQNDLQSALREQQEMLRARLRDQFDPAMFDTPAARRAVLDQLINQRLLLAEARSLGITVTDDALRDFIANIPVLQENGKFSFAKYEAFLREQGLTQAGFEQRLRQELTLRQLSSVFSESSVVSKSTAEAMYAAMAESRSVQEHQLPVERFLARVQVADEDVRKEYERDRTAFEEPERVRLEYVVLSLDSFVEAATVTEAEAKAWYESHKDRFLQPEERRASHILIAAEKTQPDARTQAKTKAESLLKQLRGAPADFAKLARQHSQDPGSASNDGDLGFFARGAMVKAFEDAAFSLKEKDISEVVETDFGFHIIMLTAIRHGKERPFGEVRAEIEAELKKQNAQKLYVESAESFSNMVYEQADNLKGVVSKFKLASRDSGWLIKGATQPAGSPFANAKLVKAIFSDDAIRNKRNTEAVEIAPNTLVSARVVEHQPQTVKPLDTVKDQIRDRLARKAAGALASKEGEAKLNELRAGKEGGVTWSAPRSVSRVVPGGLSIEVVKAVMAAPAKALPAYVGVVSTRGDYSLFRINAVDKSAKLTSEVSASLGQELLGIKRSEEAEAYLSSLKAKHKVDINSAALDRR